MNPKFELVSFLTDMMQLNSAEFAELVKLILETEYESMADLMEFVLTREGN